jgi:predicted nucleic acid-binding protein
VISGLLDTNIIIDLLNQQNTAINWSASVHLQEFAITPVVWMETVEGARDRIERAQIIRFLRQFRIEHPTPGDNDWAMLQFGRFYLSHGVEMADVMIASVAVRLSVTLFTLNIRHYAPLPDVDERKPY